MKYKMPFIVALILLVVSNVVWLATFIDQMITYDHSSQECKLQRENLSLVESMLLDFSKNVDKEEIVTTINNKYSNHLIGKDDGYFFVDNVGLKFDKGKLIEIVYMNEFGTDKASKP